MKQIKLLAVLFLLVIGISASVAQVRFNKFPSIPGKISGGKVMAMNTKQFHSVFKNNRGNGRRVAVVDFGADWCGWCKKQEPVMQRLAAKYAGQVDFYKVDTDANPDLAAELGISGIPVILVFPVNGSPIQLDGYQEYDEMVSAIQRVR